MKIAGYPMHSTLLLVVEGSLMFSLEVDSIRVTVLYSFPNLLSLIRVQEFKYNLGQLLRFMVADVMHRLRNPANPAVLY